jgi:glycosyltransferase involved in cell wall biosynthesis
MRILIVHRYYWPDQTPCAVIMRAIAQHLSAVGNVVDVLSSYPSYRPNGKWGSGSLSQMPDDIEVKRLRLPYEVGHPIRRVLNALYLGLWILLRAFARRYDVIISTSIPPVLGGFFSALAAKRTNARFIYYCMDLHPEIGRVSGDFANPVLFRLLQRIDDWSCRQARPVLVHSADMLKTLRSRPRGGEYSIEIMNNFALPIDGEREGTERLYLGAANNRLTVIYAGNIGRFQGFEAIVDAMGLIADRKDVLLIIMGDGIVKADLIERVRVNNSNVRFIDYQPVEVAKHAIQQADIGLVTLIPEIYKYAYPSKTMTYLEQGRPIIAAVEPWSELSQDMQSQGYGFSVPIGNAKALAELLIRLADDDSWKQKMNAAALSIFEPNFSAQVVLKRWSRLVKTGSVV